MGIIIKLAPPIGTFTDKGLFSSSGVTTPPTGATAVVTLALAGETSGADVNTPGIVTSPPFNLVRLLDQNKDELVHAATRSKVYGRLTFGGGIWTLSYFFTSVVGAETAISNIGTDTTLGAGLTDIQMAGVPKVFTSFDPARPILERPPVLEMSWALDVLKTNQLITSPVVNFKSIATTALYTVPTGKTAVILGAVARPTTATAVTGDATASIGIAGGSNDIFLPQIMANMRTVGSAWVFAGNGLTRTCPGGSVINVGVTVGALGTTLQGVIDLIGYLY